MQWHIQNPSSGLVLSLLFPKKKKKWTTCLYNHHRTRGAPAPFCLRPPPPESPETPLIISPVFALRPHGQASKTSGQIGVYECKHPACHTVSVRERVDVDKKQLDGDSQSSQTPRRHGFWSSLPSHGLSVFVSKNRKVKKQKNKKHMRDRRHAIWHDDMHPFVFWVFFPHLTDTPRPNTSPHPWMFLCCSTLCWKGTRWRGLVSFFFFF